MCHSIHVEAGRQLVGASSLLSLFGCQELNSVSTGRKDLCPLSHLTSLFNVVYTSIPESKVAPKGRYAKPQKHRTVCVIRQPLYTLGVHLALSQNCS